jgi:4-amino-4-deoxy-L-arabinose transferase-like glycosyltransferase
MKQNKKLAKFLPEITLLITCFASRLFRLSLLPMFEDEATHIRWAIKMSEGPVWEFSNVGKFLTLWIMSLVLPFADNNLLWLARFVSVCFGLFGLVGCYLLGKRLFDRRVGLLAAVLYLVVPYTFFHDRMALADSPLAVLAIYVVLFSVELSRKPGLKYSIWLGLALLLATLTKFNGFVQGVFPLLVMVIHYPKLNRNLPWKWLLLALSIGGLGFVPLLANFSSHWESIWSKTRLSNPDTALWLTWLLNGRDALLFLVRYMSLPVFIILCFGVAVAIIRRRPNDLLLVGVAGITLATFVLLSKANRWFPRYLMPAVPFLLLIAARAVILIGQNLSQYVHKTQTKNWAYVLTGGVTVLIILPALWFDYWLITDPSRAPFVEIDQWQYVSGIHAGYGLPEAANYLRDQLAESGPIMVYDQRQRIIHVILDFSHEDPDELAQSLLTQSTPVFVVASDPPEAPYKIDLDSWEHTKRVARFERPGGLSSINIYQGE